jgi:hypothetical protein
MSALFGRQVYLKVCNNAVVQSRERKEAEADEEEEEEEEEEGEG